MGEELRKWRINGVNGRVVRRIIRTVQKFGESWQRDVDGKWAVYAAAEPPWQEIDPKRGISLLVRPGSLNGMSRQVLLLPELNSALKLKRVAQFIRIIYHLSKFRKRQNMKSFVLTCAQ